MFKDVHQLIILFVNDISLISNGNMSTHTAVMAFLATSLNNIRLIEM